MQMSRQIDALRKLGLSDAEIEQVLADDKRIDKGEKLFKKLLTNRLKCGIIKMFQGGATPDPQKKTSGKSKKGIDKPQGL